jgi:hypothetical protein
MNEPGLLLSLGWLGFTLRRRLGLATSASPAPDNSAQAWPEVWVVSPGGVGTTALIHHIAKFRRTNAPDDSDGRKHLPKPPRLRAGDATRFVFVSGDVDQIVQSLARRGWLTAQAANLGVVLGVLTRGAVQRRSLVRAVKRQAQAWQTGAPGPVIYLDYAELWDAGPQLAGFLGIGDPAFQASFPRRRARTSRP